MLGLVIGRRKARSTLLIAAVLLVPAAIAWACLPQATLKVRPGSAHPGAKVKVSGTEWGSGRVRVKIRWNSTHGRVIGRARGASFSKRVRIPRVRRGTYIIVATARFPDHVWVERTAVRVR